VELIRHCFLTLPFINRRQSSVFHKKFRFSCPYFDEDRICCAIFIPRPAGMQIKSGVRCWVPPTKNQEQILQFFPGSRHGIISLSEASHTSRKEAANNLKLPKIEMRDDQHRFFDAAGPVAGPPHGGAGGLGCSTASRMTSRSSSRPGCSNPSAIRRRMASSSSRRRICWNS